MKSKIPDEPAFVVQAPDSPVRQVALNLIRQLPDQEQEPIGTAIWIAPRLLLTAKHNIEYMVRDLTAGEQKSGEISNFGILAYQVFNGPKYGIWEVIAIWTSAESDLALLYVRFFGSSHDEIKDYNAALQIRAMPPIVGSKVVAFGFSNQTYSSKEEKEKGITNNLLNDTPQATTGKVQKVFEQSRDSGMYNFPCFQINAQIDSGMSGGPVFDERGTLIGVLCGSLPPSGNVPAVGYCCTLWPLLRILLPPNPNAIRSAERIPAIDLALKGFLKVVDLAKLNPQQFPGRKLPASDKDF